MRFSVWTLGAPRIPWLGTSRGSRGPAPLNYKLGASGEGVNCALSVPFTLRSGEESGANVSHSEAVSAGVPMRLQTEKAFPWGSTRITLCQNWEESHEAHACVYSGSFGCCDCGAADRVSSSAAGTESHATTGARADHPDPELQHLPSAAECGFTDLWSAAQQGFDERRRQ